MRIPGFLFIELIVSLFLIGFISNVLFSWYLDLSNRQLYYKKLLNALNIATALTQDSNYVYNSNAFLHNIEIKNGVLNNFVIKYVTVSIYDGHIKKELKLCNGYIKK